MSCLDIYVSPEEETVMAELLKFDVEAPGMVDTNMCIEESLHGPSHLGWTGNNNSHSWVETTSGILDWCVLPTLFDIAFPQSPTSVDDSSLLSTNHVVEMSDAGDGSTVPDERKPDMNDVERLSFKLDTMCIEATRDQELNTKHEDNIKAKMARHDWVSQTESRHEQLRRRQRGYERVYRKKKLNNRKAVRDEWACLEMKLHVMLVERAKARRTDVPTTPYEELLHEERALYLSNAHLTSIINWTQIVEYRNYKGIELRSKESFAAMERTVLGPTHFKPFRPLRFTFEW